VLVAVLRVLLLTAAGAFHLDWDSGTIRAFALLIVKAIIKLGEIESTSSHK